MGNGQDVQAGLAAFKPRGADAQTLQGPTPPQAPSTDAAAGMTAMSTAAAPPPQQAPSAAAPAPVASAPGSFAWKLAKVLGGTMQALQAVGAPQGPIMSKPTEVPAGGGGLFGARSAVASVQEEQQKRAIQEREQSRLDEAQKIEKQKAAAYIAHENVSTYHDQMLTWQMGDEAAEKSATSGNMLMQPFTAPTTGQHAADIFQKNVDGDDLQAMLQKANQDQYKKTGKYLDPTQQHIFPTGTKSVVVGHDAQGQPIMRKRQLYTVIEDMPDVTLDPTKPEGKKLIDYINKFTDQNLSGDTQTKMPGYLYGTVAQQAKSAETAEAAIEAWRSDLDLEKHTAESRSSYLKNLPAVGAALAKNNGHPLATMGTLEAEQKGLGMAYIEYAFGGDKTKTALEVATHAEAELKMAELRQSEADARYGDKVEWQRIAHLGDAESMRAAMTPAMASQIDMIGQGRMKPSNLARIMSTNPDMMEVAGMLYPHFDSSKIDAYSKTYADFTSGQVARRLKAGATAMRHMLRLYQNTTELSRVAGTPEEKTRTSDFNTLAEELAGFYKVSGSPTDQDIQNAKTQLGGNAFYSANRQSALQEQARLVQDGLKDFNQTWKAAAPSAEYEAQQPDISDESKASGELVRGGGKVFIDLGNGKRGTLTSVDQVLKFRELQQKQAAAAAQQAQGAK